MFHEHVSYFILMIVIEINSWQPGQTKLSSKNNGHAASFYPFNLALI